MMTVGNATNANNSIQGYQGGGMQMDATSKSIQKQIANAQKQLQELSSNDKMPLEEKMKKRQEIQQEISRLQQQLMQHQIEQRKQQAQKADLTMQQNQKPKLQEKRNGFSQPGMQAMLSADFSIKQAKVQGNVAAENSFGGTVNSTFYAEYNNQLQIIYMTFDGEFIINER